MNSRSSFALLFFMFVLFTGLIHSAYDPTSGTGGGGNVFLGGSNKMNNFTTGTTNFYQGPLMLGNDNVSPLIFISAGTVATNVVERFRMYVDTSVGNVWKLDSTSGNEITSDFGRVTITPLFRTLDASQMGDTVADVTTVYALKHFGGATSTNRYSATATLDFPSTLAANESQLSITVTGTATGDEASIGVPFASAANGGIFTQFTSNNVVWIRFSNASGLAIDPPSGTFRATSWKY